MRLPISLHVLKRPIIPEITLILSMQRELKSFEYEKYLMQKAVELIEMADQRECRGKIIAVDASELIKGLSFNENLVRCHFTLVFNNDYNLNNFLKLLNSINNL